jgi:GMP synthase PP-ATPase subunit
VLGFQWGWEGLMSDGIDVTGAAVLATYAQLNALIAILIEKNALSEFEMERMMKSAISTLGSAQVVRTNDSERLQNARKLLEHARSAMRENVRSAPFKL